MSSVKVVVGFIQVSVRQKEIRMMRVDEITEGSRVKFIGPVFGSTSPQRRKNAQRKGLRVRRRREREETRENRVGPTRHSVRG